MKVLIVLPMLLLLSSCYFFKDGSAPLKTIHYLQQEQSNKNIKSKKLLVLLPGIGDSAASFEQHKIIDEIHSIAPGIDVIAVDAHFKYYQEHTIIERLRTDVIAPARAAGYREIYLGGISLGGFGSLLYLKQHPDDINKILILSPYLGEKEDFDYLLMNESAPKGLRDRNLWPWLTHLNEETKQKIYLAYGASDKFAQQNGLLARQLPSNHLVLQPGEHHWDTWKVLWPELLRKIGNNNTIAAQE